MINFQEKANFIWSVADLLRGDYKQSEYGKVILPFTVLRRLDCVLEPTKPQVLEKLPTITAQNVAPFINRLTGQSFFNTSRYDFKKLKDDANNIAANLTNYINGFSPNALEIIDYFSFPEQITRLDNANILYMVINKFAEIDLHPDVVSNTEMGYIFEELIRKFSEISNETAGEHFTPREVIRLMVNILFNEDSDILRKDGVVRTLFDPACGTGGMLSVAQEYLQELNSKAQLEVFGQELNGEAYAICQADMMLKGSNPQNIQYDNSFTKDGFSNDKFDYMLSNPPFGVEWKEVESEIRDEQEKLGFAGWFGAGLPRISDGSLLFLQHMIAKMKQGKEGSRIGIVFNGSPLFTGDAGSGESEIRKWIIENDWLEALIAMPDQLFYNTGISTYIWIVTNRKNDCRKGKIQLINAVNFFVKMRKSLGNKRNEISKDQIVEIVRIYGDFREGEYCKIFDNEEFGFKKIVVERPLRLNFQTSVERIQELYNQASFTNLAISKKKGDAGLAEIVAGKKLQEDVVTALHSMDGSILYKDREVFIKDLKKSFKQCGVDLNAVLLKAILIALAEKDDTAVICRDAKGNPEPDGDLRDTESVPLKEDIDEYFKREVIPHVPDAWIDESKTKIGYEIPFTRHFYTYEAATFGSDLEGDCGVGEEHSGEVKEGDWVMNAALSGGNNLDLQSLYNQLTELIQNSRRKIELVVNTELVLLHWNIGKIIKTSVLQSQRGEYGKQTIDMLSQQLMTEYGRGFSRRNLFNMISFYETFPEISIVQSLSAQLTWTHFLELMAINDEVKRDFYLTMSINERWSVRTLRERIAAMLYERTAISKRPEETIQADLVRLRQDKTMSPELFFRDPYILDFLELRDVYTEKDLESAILAELERFILEFGVDFAFLARQKRIIVDGEDYYIDLLFYHRKMRRLVLIELKLDKFRPEHKGQVELYLRWLDKHERMPGEESPLALILCAEESSETIELLELDKSGIHVAQYLTEMPPKEILERKLHQAIARAQMMLEQRGVYGNE